MYGVKRPWTLALSGNHAQAHHRRIADQPRPSGPAAQETAQPIALRHYCLYANLNPLNAPAGVDRSEQVTADCAYHAFTAFRPMHSSRFPRGFTLIEVMVVVIVITLLAALVAPNVFRNLGTAKEGAARSQMEMLTAALDAYRLDNGQYPTTQQGLQALWSEPDVAPRPPAWNGPYLRKRVPNDPWKTPYVYRFPGEENPHGFDLLTLGADAQPGGEGENADIRAWE